MSVRKLTLLLSLQKLRYSNESYNMKQLLPILAVLLLMNACVPYKKVVYLQGELPQQEVEKKPYVIKKNDILYIQMKSADENLQKLFENISPVTGNNTNQVNAKSLYFNGYTVDESGYIELPIVKKLHVAGESFDSVKAQIRKQLGTLHLLKTGDIFINIKLAGVPFTILGEVKNPQKGVIYKDNPTLFDVIGDAGDITLVGDRQHVQVVRNEGGKTTKTALDLTQADVFSSPYFYLRPNDIIYVRPLKQKTLGTGTTLTQTISTTISALSLITTIILFTKYVK